MDYKIQSRYNSTTVQLKEKKNPDDYTFSNFTWFIHLGRLLTLPQMKLENLCVERETFTTHSTFRMRKGLLYTPQQIVDVFPVQKGHTITDLMQTIVSPVQKD